MRAGSRPLPPYLRLNPPCHYILAEEGIRTLDLRFTKPLLYQLSYLGTLPTHLLFLLQIQNIGYNFEILFQCGASNIS